MNYDLMNGGELAFVGDALMTLQVREYLVNQGITHLKELQKRQVEYVNAAYQASFAHKMEDRLSEKEHEIFLRGRNFKSHSSAKNASIIDYRYATALEALWGYWYLKGETERISEMLVLFLSHADE